MDKIRINCSGAIHHATTGLTGYKMRYVVEKNELYLIVDDEQLRYARRVHVKGATAEQRQIEQVSDKQTQGCSMTDNDNCLACMSSY
jgi:hypothetical protein